MTNTLEQIFWKEGKFVNSDGEEVMPKAIGGPKLISIQRDIKHLKISKEDIIKHLERNYNYLDANSVLIGRRVLSWSSDGEPGLNLVENRYSYPVQFYKIN